MLQVFQVLCHCLMYCNSCINPFIYNYASKYFRDGFRDVMSRWGLYRDGGGSSTTAQTNLQTQSQRDRASTGTGRGGRRARTDTDEANNEGENIEMAENEFIVGEVYCGPAVEHYQMELNPLNSPTYV